MPCLVGWNAVKRDTGGHILTEWPFCHVKSAIEHKRRYAHHLLADRTSYFGFVLTHGMVFGVMLFVIVNLTKNRGKKAMGGWEDVFGEAGMQADFAPWDSPCWNSDWEDSLREEGNLTVKEWNRKGRKVKAGEKGRWLPCAKVTVFSEAQTYAVNGNKMRFDTFSEALDWAKEHPERSITRCPMGRGFVEK